MNHIAVVGASMAGTYAAETLREAGFDGTITMVGEEPHRPYDRPPLSKQVLAGEWEADRLALPVDLDRLDLEWRLGSRATALDLDGRELVLGSKERLSFDGLVIATGAEPRRLPGTPDVAGVHVLRTVDDCLALRADLDATPRRVAVVGAGFIGAEVAATCRGRGLDVTVVEALPQPLSRALGIEMGVVWAEMHRDHGVDLRLGVGVDGFVGDDPVGGVRLSDGEVVEADVVVVGVGVRPVTGWLEGSGLTLDDGVVCDETCQAAPGVVAAGDVARWRNPLFDEQMRVEHWENAIEQGKAAALRLLAGDGDAEPFAPVPWFWSDQYDRKIQLAGRAGPDDEIAIVHGSTEERRFVALYGRAGRVVGVLGVNRPRHVMQYRQKIADRTSWDDALAFAADQD